MMAVPKALLKILPMWMSWLVVKTGLIHWITPTYGRLKRTTKVSGLIPTQLVRSI